MDLWERLTDKRYRDTFTEELVLFNIPLKIRALRRERGLTQVEFANRRGWNAKRISSLEEPGGNACRKIKMDALLEIASAFDVALVVDFIPFNELVKRASFDPNTFSVPSFGDDPRQKESLDW